MDPIVLACIVVAVIAVVVRAAVRKERPKLTCPRCGKTVNYLTMSLESKFGGVCQECAGKQWKEQELRGCGSKDCNTPGFEWLGKT